MLSLIVSEYLYSKYAGEHAGRPDPDAGRGSLRAALVRYAQKLGLAVSPGSGAARRKPGQGAQINIADAFEATLAAIYLDGGKERAAEYVCLL